MCKVCTWLPLRPSHGSWPWLNISHSVTPNIQVSLACEKVLVFRLSGAHLIKHRMHVRQARRERKVEKKLVSTKLLTRQTEPCGAPASRNGRRSWAAHASGRSLRSWRGRWRPAGCCERPSLGGWSGVTRGTPYHMRSARCSGTAPRSGCDPAAFSTCPTENQVEPAPSPTRKHTHTHTRQTNTLLWTFCGHSKLKIHAYLINTNQL